MSRNLGALTVDLILKHGGFESGMDRSERLAKQKMDAIGKSAERAGAMIGQALGGISASLIFTRFIQNTINAQNEQAQLATVLRSTGEAAGYSATQLNAMADSLSRDSVFSAGDITTAQTALLAFTGIIGEQYPRALQAAADMAARTGMTIASSAETIGRALDVPSQGMAALSRQGFRFTEDQREIVKAMEEAGHAAEAQGIILRALESTYGGAARAARDTLGGALSGLGNQFDDLLTSDGGLPGATSAINALADAIGSPRMKAALDALITGGGILAGLMGVRLVGAAGAMVGSFVLAQAQTYRLHLALAAMGGVSATAATGMMAATAAARGLGLAMGLLGGPVGLAALAAGGLYMLYSRSQEANRELAKISEQGQLGGEALRNLAPDTIAQNIQTVTNRIDELNKKLAILRNQPGSGRGGKKNTRAIGEAERDLSGANEILDDLYAQQQQQAVQRYLTEQEEKTAKALGDRLLKEKEAREAQKKAAEEAAKARKQEAEALESQYGSILANLNEQVALFYDTTKAAAIRYRTESGDLQKLTAVQKQDLILRAQRLDAMQAEKKALDDFDKMLDGIFKDQDERTQRLKDQAVAQERFVAGLHDEVEAARQAADMKIAGMGMGAQRRAEYEELTGIQQDYARRRAELGRDQMDKDKALSEKAYADALEALKKAEEERIQVVKDSNQRIREAQGDWQIGASRAYEDYLENARNIAGQSEDLFKLAFGGMEDVLVNFVETGKLSFRDLGQSILRELVSGGVKNAMASLLGSLKGMGGGAGGLLSSLGSLFAGGRASGGPVMPGRAYLVGERGPELIVPGASAHVVDAERTSGLLAGRGVSQVFNVTTPDADSFRRSQRQIARQARRGLRT